MSFGLLAALIVLFAVVLTFAVNSDDRAESVTAPAAPAPLSYYVDGSGDGLVGGHDQAVVPALRAHTGEFQGEGLVHTTGGLSVNRPMAHYQPFAGEGVVGGNLDAGVILSAGDILSYEEQARLAHDEMLLDVGNILSYEEQARLAHDEMLFQEWNDPLGWLPAPVPAAVQSYQDALFWEQNVFFGSGALAETPAIATVDPYAQMRFLEMNTELPGWSEGAKLAGVGQSDRQRFTQS